ncbi:MAG: M16 family metallopeptidase [Bacteroidota bacterium]
MLDRKSQPAPAIAEKIEWIEATSHKMDNGGDLFVVNAGEQDVLRLEIILPKGAADTTSSGLSMAAHQLTDSGTSKMDSKSIAEAFDRLGSFYQSDAGPDFRNYTIYAMRSSFSKTLDVLRHVIEEATFPEQEVELWKKRNIETLKVNREKVSWLSRTAFNEALFGTAHPYGFTALEHDYESITSEGLRNFHSQQTLMDPCMVMLSGKVGDAEIEMIKNALGKSKRSVGNPTTTAPGVHTLATVSKHITKEDAMQSAIRVGRRVMTKHHPDYIPFQMASAVLGGYFGSRLMSNIREDKGYTYGIGSAIVPNIQCGYFFIATEVGKDVCQPAIEEIFKELERLTKEPAPETEINLVRNYLLGEFQRNLDGPFALADRFKNLKLYGLGYDYLNKYLNYLNNFSSDSLMETANTYLQPAEMTQVIAG